MRQGLPGAAGETHRSARTEREEDKWIKRLIHFYCSSAFHATGKVPVPIGREGPKAILRCLGSSRLNLCVFVNRRVNIFIIFLRLFMNRRDERPGSLPLAVCKEPLPIRLELMCMASINIFIFIFLYIYIYITTEANRMGLTPVPPLTHHPRFSAV